MTKEPLTLSNMKDERKAQASFRVYEVRDGVEFPIIDETTFTEQDKTNVILDLNFLMQKLCKHWNIDIKEFVERQQKIMDLEMMISKKTQEKYEKDRKEFEAWKAKKIKDNVNK